MKRVEIPAAETQSGEARVLIVARAKDVRRLRWGAAAHRSALEKMIGYGFETAHSPQEVDAARGQLAATLADVESPEDSPHIRWRSAELSLGQAAVFHAVAVTMLAEVDETAFKAIALTWGDDRPAAEQHDWHESPRDAWARIKAGLAPPPETTAAAVPGPQPQPLAP